MILPVSKIDVTKYHCMGYDSTPVPHSLCFCGTQKSLQTALANPNITGIITTPPLAEAYNTDDKVCYTHPAPKSYFWQLWQRQGTPHTYTQPNTIAPDVMLAGAVHIDKTGVNIGKNVKIGAFTVIKSGTTIGDNVTIGANCVLGGESLQTFTKDNNTDNTTPILVKHMGEVHIKNHVTILDGTLINRGVFTYQPTIVHPHCIVDNNVTIAHGCQIGKNTQIAPAVQLCGRVIIGDHTFIGASVTVLNNTEIGDDCYIGIGEKITRSVPDKTRVTVKGICPN